MTKIQAFIFDLDGVIVDTAKYHFLAWKRLADELQIPFDEADNEHLKGVSRVDSLQYILKLGNKTLDTTTFQDCLTRKNEWFTDYIYSMAPDEILPGVQTFLTFLKERHYRIALGSASKNARLILDKIGMTHFFEVIIDGNAVTQAKPNPEVFLKGAEGLGVAPENCVVFEDGIAGVEAAQRAGMKAIGVGSPDILGSAEKVISGFSPLSPKGGIEDLLQYLDIQ